jgi:predicted DsbA family dithiol-disulfide isomerase
MAPLQVEIWSDLVCPWCYIGKRRFEAAVERFEGEVEVSWRSFELDPSAPAVREHTATDHLAAKYGMSREQAESSHAQMTELAAQEGLEYHFERARGGNSFDAHREIGVDAKEVLDSDDYADAVREDEHLAQRIGIQGVPFFVLDRRYGVSGAQPAELLVQALEKACA